MMRRGLCAAVALAALAPLPLLVPRVARADASQAAAAQALFEEGRRLVTAGHFAEACPKLAESQKLDPGTGTLIHLGNCYEKNGQTASAWATFTDAVSAARAQGRADWEELSRGRVAALLPKLSNLVIRAPAGAEVKRNGIVVAEASWGLAIPVDPGEHRIAASAPKKKTWSQTITITSRADRAELQIPALEDEAPEQVVAPPASRVLEEPEAPRSASGQRTVGFIVGGVGIAGLAVGTVTGLIAMGKNAEANRECPTDGACASVSAVEASSAARGMATVSTIGFVAGGAALAAGAILVLSAPSSATKRTGHLRMSPEIAPRTAGISITGSW